MLLEPGWTRGRRQGDHEHNMPGAGDGPAGGVCGGVPGRPGGPGVCGGVGGPEPAHPGAREPLDGRPGNIGWSAERSPAGGVCGGPPPGGLPSRAFHSGGDAADQLPAPARRGRADGRSAGRQRPGGCAGRAVPWLPGQRAGPDATGGGRVCPAGPRVPSGGLRRALNPQTVAALLASCDPDTVLGRRDRAILVLLARLGLRAGEVAGLGLDDLDWRAGEISVRGKGRRRHPDRGRAGAAPCPAGDHRDLRQDRPGGAARPGPPMAGRCGMTGIRQAIDDYLTVRRALGYKLEDHGWLLADFASFLEAAGAVTVTTSLALAWATLPEDALPSWHAARLRVVRGFARHLQALDPATEVPPAGLLACRNRRAMPYLYSD